MRDLILKMSISLDGFVSDLEGRNSWMFGADPQAKAWVVAHVGGAGLHIMGSRTFRDMAAWWPTSEDSFAPPMNQIPKAVFSRRGLPILPAAQNPAGLQPGAQSWAQAYVAGGDLAAEVAALKAMDGKPIIAHGGVSFARSLVAAGLVDQFTLIVAPVALGKGHALFSDLAGPMPLRLINAHVFSGGAAALMYRAA